MFRTILKWTGIALLCVVVLLVGTFLFFMFSFKQQKVEKHDIAVAVSEIVADSSLVALGDRLSIVRGCRDCHGDDLGGKTFIDDAALGTIYSANLTAGDGGIGASYTDADWIRAIRHGVRADSTAIMIMPSYEYIGLSDSDVAAIVAYVKQVPAVDRVHPESEIRPLTYVLNGLGALKVFVAKHMDHTVQPSNHTVPAVSLEYGEYIAVTCTGCHGPAFKGGVPPAPGFMIPADISGSSRVASWTEDEFVTALRTGIRPDGTTLDQKDMPWQLTKEMTDTELKALFLFLKSTS